MLEKESLKDFSLEELKIIKSDILNTKTQDELITLIDNLIIEKKQEEQSLNARFDLEMFKRLKIFPPTELSIIESNGIHNLKELRSADLSTLKGIIPSAKRYIEWARNFYNMEQEETIEIKSEKNLKKKNNKNRNRTKA